MKTLTIVCLLMSGVALAAEPPDKDRQILELRRQVAAEKLERLRLEFIIIKGEHDKLVAELAKTPEKQKEVKEHEAD